MTYSSARGAVEDAGAGARARGMTVTNAMEDDSFSLTRGFRDSLTIHDWSDGKEQEERGHESTLGRRLFARAAVEPVPSLGEWIVFVVVVVVFGVYRDGVSNDGGWFRDVARAAHSPLCLAVVIRNVAVGG